MRSPLRAFVGVKGLRERLPFVGIERDMLISANMDLTVGFDLELPEAYTLTEEGYRHMHEIWCRALELLPDHTLVHRQDIYRPEAWHPDGVGSSRLERASDRHFDGREFTEHRACLFITLTDASAMRAGAAKSSLLRPFRGSLRPEPSTDAFLAAVAQMEGMLRAEGHISLRKLRADDWCDIRTGDGILERYLSLSPSGCRQMCGLELSGACVTSGERHLAAMTFPMSSSFPQSVRCVTSDPRLSGEDFSIPVSFAYPMGLGLRICHIYNQVIYLCPSEPLERELSQRARNMRSLAAYSSANLPNAECIEDFLERWRSDGLRPVRSLTSMMLLSDSREELRQATDTAVAACQTAGFRPHMLTLTAPLHFWAMMPGGEWQCDAAQMSTCFLEEAACMFQGETRARSHTETGFGLRLTDRNGMPLRLDISDWPMSRRLTSNRNKFVLGPSGSGKSFFMNHMVRTYYEAGAHIVLIDTGNSYRSLAAGIRRASGGRDGIYYIYDDEAPLSFNPFFSPDGKYGMERRESLRTLILTLWRKQDEQVSRVEEVAVSLAVNTFLDLAAAGEREASMDGFIGFLRSGFEEVMRREKVRKEDFDLANLTTALSPFALRGEWGTLLNAASPPDLAGCRMVVFEIDAIKDHPVLFPVTTLIIMDLFMQKLHMEGQRKVIIIEEAWKAISSGVMAGYIRYLYKTVRKHFGEAVTVTQEIGDIISSPVVRDTIVNNSDCRILLDQSRYRNRFSEIADALGLDAGQKDQILSMNMSPDRSRRYRDVWIGLGPSWSGVYGVEVSESEYMTYTTEPSDRASKGGTADKEEDTDTETNIQIR